MDKTATNESNICCKTEKKINNVENNLSKIKNENRKKWKILTVFYRKLF